MVDFRKFVAVRAASVNAPSGDTPVDIHAAKILILDFGSQYTQLIARRVRELGVYCEIHRPDLSAEEIRRFAPRGIILSGGPASVEAPGSPR